MCYVFMLLLFVACSGEQKPTAPAGKTTDDDCAFCDLFGAFNDQQEEEEDETEEEAETDSTSSEGGPDLIVQSPSVNDSILTPEQAFTLQATVHNQGDEQAAATMLYYYRSNNTKITASDTEVGTDEIGTLAASDSSVVSVALTAPMGGGPGVYFYGACVDSVSSESNTDNNCSSAVMITVSRQEPSEEDDETLEEEEDETTQDGTDGDVASVPSTRLLTHGRGPRWSSDGQRIVFYSSRNGWWDIYSIDADGTNEIRLTTHETGESAPTWSPDGFRIAFTSYRDGYDGHQSIHIMDSDGTNETRLTENNRHDASPTWSPDGRRIAYVSQLREDNRLRLDADGLNSEIYVMDADGSNKTRLTQYVEDDWLPTWSPDSQSIAFLSARSSPTAIYIMAADGSNKQRLTQDNRSFDPAWSPDGTSIAYSSLHSGDDGLYEIYVMDADGSNKQRLTWAEGYDISPAWSPDGERIAFVSERDGDMEIYVMDADGSNKQRLTYGAGKDGNVPSALAWSPDPDSQRIVFERDRDEEIYIVEFVEIEGQ